MPEKQRIARWKKYVTGTDVGTIYENQPWVDDFFNAVTFEDAKKAIEKQFGDKLKVERHFIIENENNLFSWEERFALLSIFRKGIVPVFNIYITEDMIKPANICNPIQDPFDSLWSFGAALTNKGNAILYTGFPPGHPDSDYEYAGVLVDRNGKMLCEFFSFERGSYINTVIESD